MFPAGFKPTIAASKQLQNYALDRAATGTGQFKYCTRIGLNIAGPSGRAAYGVGLRPLAF